MSNEIDNYFLSAIKRAEKGKRPVDIFVTRCLRDLCTGKYLGEEVFGQRSLMEAVEGRNLILARFIGFQQNTLRGGDVLWTKNRDIIGQAQVKLSETINKYLQAPLRIPPETDHEILSILRAEGLNTVGSLQAYTNLATKETSICLVYPKPLSMLGCRLLAEMGLEVTPWIGANILTANYFGQFRLQSRTPIVSLGE